LFALPFEALPRVVLDLEGIPAVLEDASPEAGPRPIQVPLIIPSVQVMKETALTWLVFLVGLRRRFRSHTPRLETVPVRGIWLLLVLRGALLAVGLLLLITSLIVSVVVLSVELVFSCFFFSCLLLTSLLICVLLLIVLRATVLEPIWLILFTALGVGSSPLKVFVGWLSASAIKVLIRVVLLPLLATCIISSPGLGVPEPFELILEVVLGLLLPLAVPRVEVVEVILGLVVLVEVPRGLLLLLPLLLILSPLILKVIGAASGTSWLLLLPLRVRVVIGFSKLVVEGPLSLILQDLVSCIDLLELFLKRFIPLGFIWVILLCQFVISLFDVWVFGSGWDT
jgi:hypothetical protein